MEQGISRWEFWSGVIVALAPYLYQIYARWRDSKDKEPEQKINENEKQLQAWEDIAEGYAKQIERLRGLETENAELRPLLLKVALQAQDIKQCQDDKEDWKRYAGKLAKQLESHSIIPLPFRRTPQDEDTDSRLSRPVSDKVKAVQKIIKDNDKTVTNAQNGE